MKNFFGAVIVAFFLTGCEGERLKTIEVNDQVFRVEVADTPEKRSEGLMHRDFLAPDRGMLFEFEESGLYPFWMKNTQIPLWGIWISEDQEVVDVMAMEPCLSDPCPNYTPKGEAKWVLEIAPREGFWPEKVELFSR